MRSGVRTRDGAGSPEGVRKISSGPQGPPTTPTGRPLVSGTLPTRPTCPTLRSQGTAQNPAYRPARPLNMPWLGIMLLLLGGRARWESAGSAIPGPGPTSRWPVNERLVRTPAADREGSSSSALPTGGPEMGWIGGASSDMGEPLLSCDEAARRLDDWHRARGCRVAGSSQMAGRSSAMSASTRALISSRMGRTESMP